MIDICSPHSRWVEQIDICNLYSLTVEQMDAARYLEGLAPSGLDGVFMDDVIEHGDTNYALCLLGLINSRLAPKCAFILKTINPLSLAIFADFFIEPTYSRAIHPEALRFIISGPGFGVDIRFSARVADQDRLKKIELSPGLSDG